MWTVYSIACGEKYLKMIGSIWNRVPTDSNSLVVKIIRTKDPIWPHLPYVITHLETVRDSENGPSSHTSIREEMVGLGAWPLRVIDLFSSLENSCWGKFSHRLHARRTRPDEQLTRRSNELCGCRKLSKSIKVSDNMIYIIFVNSAFLNKSILWGSW